MPSFRYDTVEVSGTKTAEGFLVASPVVARVGVLNYRQPDGTIRAELRLPEEVFREDSLDSFAGKPITDGHPQQLVSSANAKNLSVGFIKTKGMQSGDNVVVDIVVMHNDAIDKIERQGKRELSIGYTLDLEMAPGVYNNQRYDAIQRNIQVNHLAIVQKGRAGNARINFDGLDDITEECLNESEIKPMTTKTIRLDNGLSYQAPPEVEVELERLRKDSADLRSNAAAMTKSLDTVTAERDILKQQTVTVDQVRKDALDKAIVEVKARQILETTAGQLKIETKDKTNRQIQEGVIKHYNKDADLTGKSDDYVQAAFDMSKTLVKTDAAAQQRQTVSGVNMDAKAEGGNPQFATSNAQYEHFMGNLGFKG